MANESIKIEISTGDSPQAPAFDLIYHLREYCRACDLFVRFAKIFSLGRRNEMELFVEVSEIQHGVIEALFYHD